jgi:hypothetical protein
MQAWKTSFWFTLVADQRMDVVVAWTRGVERGRMESWGFTHWAFQVFLGAELVVTHSHSALESKETAWFWEGTRLAEIQFLQLVPADSWIGIGIDSDEWLGSWEWVLQSLLSLDLVCPWTWFEDAIIVFGSFGERHEGCTRVFAQKLVVDVLYKSGST